MRTFLGLCLVVLAACSGEAGDPEAQYQRELASASSQAKGKLPFFWEHFEAPQDGEYDFSLKAAIPRRDGQQGAEEAWLENIARGPDKIVGELSVDPKYLGDLREGAIVEIQESQVVDWAFMRGNELLGHYTTRVMLPKLDPVQVEWLRPLLSETPDGS